MRIHLVRRPAHIFSAGLLGASALFSLPAMAQDESVFFCPPSVIAGMSKPTKGIMCSAETCYDSQSPELSSEQKSFLLSNGSCRYLTPQEVASYWHKPAAGTQRASN
jgi:hypothetical protein